MAITFLEVDVDQLREDTKVLGDCIVKASKSLADCVGEMDELNEMWRGRANEAFKAQFRQDVLLMEQVLRKTEKMVLNMEYAQKEYAKCENQVKTAVGAIRI